MSAEKIIVCNSVCEADYLFNEFLKLMDKLGELDKTRKVSREVYLTNGEKYRFVSFIQRDKIRGFRGEQISSEIFEIIMGIFKNRNNA